LEQARERALVQRAQQGDTEAFAELAAAQQRFIYNLALRALGDPQEAEDAAQEALVSAWLALPRFRGEARFRTWLYRIVTHACYKRLPAFKRELGALSEDEEDFRSLEDFGSLGQPDPAALVEDRERRAFLHRQIDALPRAARMLVTLFYGEGLSCEEIGGVLELSLPAVKTGLFRARERLRQALAAYEGGAHG
jgi:RNA polymerase sigma-70 factor, ECF subfamily